MKLLILLLWLLFGYIGCRIAGISHEYMYLHIDDAFFLIGCGPLTFIQWEDNEPWSVKDLLKLQVKE